MRKLLLAPLRLAVGWGISPRLLGWVGITMLVLLRLAIGWHFYSEGIAKTQDDSWSSAPFFANARGPYAEYFRAVVWDGDGRMRLDREETMQWFALYRERVSDHYGFDEEQQRQAQVNYAKAIEQYDWVMSEHSAEVEEYRLGRERVEQLEDDPVRDSVASLGGQRETVRRELNDKIEPVLQKIDTIWENYEDAQNSVATEQQLDAYGALPLAKPPSRFLGTGLYVDTNVLNAWVPYFDIAIGLALLLGLLTPVAALAAAGFLGSVFLSQLPPASGPTSTYYQLIEAIACLVLAGTGAGRFAGLDFFLHLIIRKTWGAPTDEE